MPQAALGCPVGAFAHGQRVCMGRLRVAWVFVITAERDEYFRVYFVVTNDAARNSRQLQNVTTDTAGDSGPGGRYIVSP